MAGGIHGPPLPGISDVEESLRTLPEIIAQPWDSKRGDKSDVLDFKNLRWLEKLQRRASFATIFPGRAPNSSGGAGRRRGAHRLSVPST